MMAWTWLLSFTGAALFFAAGAVFAGRRLVRADGPSLGLAQPPAARPSKPAPDANSMAQLTQLRSRCTTLERELAVKAETCDKLTVELETDRSSTSAVIDGLRERIAELTREADADSQYAGLKRELAMSEETLRGRDTQLEHLLEENARLRPLEEELLRAKRELTTLSEQTRELRAQAYASKPPPKRPPTKTLPPISARGRALQTIVDTETQFGGAKSAVIADELGLLVAASGATNEYNDALAALGAYLADVGTKTRDVLPLNEVRQVVVRDDHDVTLTVRPLATDDPGLALVTLAVEADAQHLTDNRHN